MLLILAQIIGCVAVGLYLLSYQLKKRVHIVFVTFVSNLFYVLQYLILGAFAGAVMDSLTTIASFLAVKKNHKNFKKYEKIILIIVLFFVVIIGTAIAVNRQSWIELLPVAGTVFQVISMWCDNEQTLRKFALCSVPLWLIYNILTNAYGAAIGSVFAIVSIIVSLVRYRKKSI